MILTMARQLSANQEMNEGTQKEETLPVMEHDLFLDVRFLPNPSSVVHIKPIFLHFLRWKSLIVGVVHHVGQQNYRKRPETASRR
jgi:hypothetical protein